MSQAFDAEYRAAIALNNMAIVLMERQAYRESLETLIDSCSLMESALRRQHSSTPEPSSNLLVDEKIHKSSERLSRSLAFNPNERSSSTTSSARPWALNTAQAVVVVNHDGVCLESRTSIDATNSAVGEGSFRISPIRLEALDSQRVEDRDPELESGMLIFNLGVAYLCLSRSECRSRSRSFKLRDVSARVFRMAYDNVAKLETLQQLMDSPQAENKENQLQLVTRLLLGHMILRHAVQAHLDNGKLLEAWETQEQLARLANTIDELGIESNEERVASASACPAPAA